VKFPAARTLVFAKAPVPGRVKTRLIPALGAAGAAQLHARLVQDTLARLAPAGLAPIELHCAPDPDHPLFEELAQRHGLRLAAQCEGDLGERLHAAARVAMASCDTAVDAVVLIGCDCPDLDAGYLAAALDALAEHDAVLGPAADGGYVLLGLRRPEPSLFSAMPWGSDRVTALTRTRLSVLGWSWRELPVLRDLDRPEDLALLDPPARSVLR